MLRTELLVSWSLGFLHTKKHRCPSGVASQLPQVATDEFNGKSKMLHVQGMLALQFMTIVCAMFVHVYGTCV